MPEYKCNITQRRIAHQFDGSSIDTYAELANFAIKRIRAHGVGAMVSGPITTGGVASHGITDPKLILKRNLEIFDCAIRYCQKLADLEMRPAVWDQMPYEKVILRLVIKEKESPEYKGYPVQLLEEFYLPVFESANFETAYMIPGWEDSKGANWEREKLEALGVTIVPLPIDFIEKAKELGIYPIEAQY